MELEPDGVMVAVIATVTECVSVFVLLWVWEKDEVVDVDDVTVMLEDAVCDVVLLALKDVDRDGVRLAVTEVVRV